MTVPAGGEINGTLIGACVVNTSNQIQCGDPNSKVGKVTSSGSSVNFTVQNVASGRYVILAQKDVNSDGKLGAGDYNGCYGDDGQGGCAVVQPPKSGLNVQMKVVSSNSSLRLNEAGRDLLQFHPARLEPIGVSPQADTPNAVVQAQVRSSAGRPAFVPGEVIVKFRQTTSPQSLSSLQANIAGRTLSLAYAQSLEGIVPHASLYRASTDEAGTLELIRQLQARPDVEYAEPNYISYAMKAPTDPFYGAQWHYKSMNLENAWDITDGTANPVTVAVVDTGKTDHPDLQGVFVGGYDFIDNDNDATDLGGDSGYHGSHVAGTIAARTNNDSGVAGVNWGARVVPVRVLGTDGSGTTAGILAGVKWAAGISVSGAPANPNPAKVINMSLGGNRTCSQTEQAVYDEVKARGVIVLVAAGNENDDAGNHSPASCRNVITVGATGPTNERAPYSNYGSRIDIMAPGGDTKRTFTFNGKTYVAGVLSTLLDDNGQPVYSFYQGTSMATPHAAGLVSLMLSRDPGLSFETILSRLKAASTPLSASACNRPSGGDCGAGLVDAARALTGTGGTPPPPPPPGSPPPPPAPPTPPAPPPPPTGSLKTYVAALRCAQTNDCNLFDENGSVIIEVQATKLEVSFKLEGLQAGTYVAAGWQDVNGNVEVDVGEPFGVAAKPFNINANQNLAGLIIRMKPFTPSNTASMSVPGSRLEDAVRYLAGRNRHIRNP